MSDQQALYEAMRRAAVDSQNAALRTRKTIGLVSGGLVVILAVGFFLLNVGPRSVRTSVPAAQAAVRGVPQVTVVAPQTAQTAHVDPQVGAALKIPAVTNNHRVASARKHHRRSADDEEASDE